MYLGGAGNRPFSFPLFNSAGMLKRNRIPNYLFLFILLISGSCSKRIYPTSENPVILYPAPPDEARIQFLTTYGSSTDFTGTRSKFSSFVVGKEEALPIKKPYGVALHRGSIVVVDSEIAGLEIMDFGKGTFTYFQPEGRGRLRMPVNCCFDEEGNMYVADVDRKQVVIFDENREYKGEIGGGENFKPTDVFVFGDSVFVTDPKNNRINVYNRSTMTMLFSFPKEAEVGDDAWLYNPLTLYVSAEKIYVTDFGNSKVKIFDMKGRYLRSVGSYGRSLGQFVRPKGIAVDREENLYVVDAAFQNVQIFNKSGQLLMFLGGAYQGPGDMYLPANISIDYDHNQYYDKYVAPDYKLVYLILVSNQFGPDKISVYGRIEPK